MYRVGRAADRTRDGSKVSPVNERVTRGVDSRPDLMGRLGSDRVVSWCVGPASFLGMRGQEVVPQAWGSASGEEESRRGQAPVREPAQVGRPDAQSADYYWPATTSAENPTNAWNVNNNNTPNSNQVCCVRGAHDATAVFTRESVPAVAARSAAQAEYPQRASG